MGKVSSTRGRGRPVAATAAAVICATVLAGGYSASAESLPASVSVATPTLVWSPCREADGFDCATATVPLNYRNPNGRTIQLAVIRRKATGPGARIGTLFFNPGGPGGPGTKALPLGYYGLFPQGVRERFDIVSWDPRGVGDSTAVRCFDSAAEANAWEARIPVGFPVGKWERETWIDAYADLARRCKRSDPELLRHVSTADTARDLDQLRQAVGDPQLTYLGISYGTFLGATYANLFPDKVRAMVLDGNVDARGWVNDGSKHEPFLTTYLRNYVDLSAAATLGQFLALCGNATTANCAFSAGSPIATRAKFDDLMQLLKERPVGTWTYPKAIASTFQDLYSVHPGWTTAAGRLQDLWEGRAPADPPAATGYPGFEQIDAIRCSESPNPRDPQSFRMLEKFSYARAGDVGRIVTWSAEVCSTWLARAADSYTGPWNRPTAHPILVVNPTYDPATPYQGGQAMTLQLGDARLLTVSGYGHTALTNPSQCALVHESRYLVDGVLPPAGAACEQDTPPFTAPSSPGVPTPTWAILR